jgi:predicted amidohydrolase YtcJ
MATIIAQGGSVPTVSADLVLKNGRIYAPAGWASAVAVRKGIIVAVGDDSSAASLACSDTRVIDLQGATVLPGLHDTHVHPMSAGLAEFQCQLPHGSSPDEILKILAKHVKRRAPGEWITGRAFEAASFGATPPNKAMLDSVAPDNPVLFGDISGHSSWANSKALALAGISRDTTDPPNGIIERDATGEPTGLLRETAGWGVARLVPPPTREQNAEALKWALDTMLAEGITALDDAAVNAPVAQAYADLADAGQLHQRVRGCLMYQEAALIAMRGLYARDRFSPSCIKILLDGVPTDSHTAAMLEDYVPVPGRDESGREKGLLMVRPDDLNVLVTYFDAMGLTVKFHAAGDAAVREALDAIEAARKANGHSGLMHNPGHNSFVHMDDIGRARALGAALEFSPYIWYRSSIIDDIERAVRPHLMKRWIPIKDALEAGVLATAGSDWNVVPSVNPWIAIEAMVTREPPGGGGEPLGAAERITLEQAIDLYTINAARYRYAADRLGTIETGKVADLVVIDQNIFEVPITRVHATKVLMTLIEGAIVYESAAR